MNIEEFSSLASQMLIVPFKVIYEDKTRNIKEEFDMKYKVGFIGCEKKEKNEVYPVQGWIISREKPSFEDPIFPFN